MASKQAAEGQPPLNSDRPSATKKLVTKRSSNFKQSNDDNKSSSQLEENESESDDEGEESESESESQSPPAKRNLKKE